MHFNATIDFIVLLHETSSFMSIYVVLHMLRTFLIFPVLLINLIQNYLRIIGH